MISDNDLAKELTTLVQSALQILDRSAALVRERAEHEAAAYVTAVGKTFMCVYSEILDPIYREHPGLAPQLWSPD
jgi:hypothetical protein